jgi:hypothetical protein
VAVRLALPLVAGLLLAGCAATAPSPPEPPAAPSLAPEAGGFYAVRHGGGDLVLDADGLAQVELWGPDDARMGELMLGHGAPIVLGELGPGEYVLRPLALNGTLSIRSDEAEPPLRPLPHHAERHLLVQRSRASPEVPFARPPPEQLLVEVSLQRAPAAMRLLADGSHHEMSVRVQGAAGTVLEADHAGQSLYLPPPFDDGGLREVPSRFHRENARDRALTASLLLYGLDGSLVLEALSYSRAEPERLPAFAAAEPAYVYGELPRQPVAFEVADSARWLVVDPGAGHAGVVLFDAQGRRLGLVEAKAAPVAVQVPARPGLIAYLALGNATLGADAAPESFGLHPVEVRETFAPATAAGTPGTYGQAEAPVRVRGTLFEAVPETRPSRDFIPLSCGPVAAAIALRQGNETVAAWGFGGPGPLPAGLFLRDGPATLLHDGHGDSGCGRAGLLLRHMQP